MREVLWALRGHSAVLALDFAFTIAVFPGLVADICSVANPATAPPCYPRVAAGRLAGVRTCACMHSAGLLSACMLCCGRARLRFHAAHAWRWKSCGALPACCIAAGAICGLQTGMHACSGDLWTPLLFLVFNGGDLLGRLLAGLGPWRRQPLSVGALLTYALSRIVLVAGLLLCHVVTPRPWALPDALRRARCAPWLTSPLSPRMGALVHLGSPRLVLCAGNLQESLCICTANANVQSNCVGSTFSQDRGECVNAGRMRRRCCSS